MKNDYLSEKEAEEERLMKIAYRLKRQYMRRKWWKENKHIPLGFGFLTFVIILTVLVQTGVIC